MRRLSAVGMPSVFFALLVGFLASVLLIGATARPAQAWGPHAQITRAALEVLPQGERWNARLGKENLDRLADYCFLPDQRGQDLGAFYADDYLLIRQMPFHVGHGMPQILESFPPYFARALQALRTETPVNACRQLGPLVHFIEDAGAPPHAKERCRYHKELENWVRSEEIVITGYEPRLLGTTDEEALAGLMRRVAGLVEFSKARAERALPLVSQPEPDRSGVEAIVLESALESARATADVLYTVLTLGLAPQPQGASLAGTVTAAPMPSGEGHGARVVLLDSDYATLATTDGSRSTDGCWRGRYALDHLASGTYRVLVYRRGSQFHISPPITLAAGKPTRYDVTLPAAEPAGNVIENPTGCLSYLQPGVPDRWKPARSAEKTVWTSSAARVDPQATYRCGASIKDPAAEVSFRFSARPDRDGNAPPPLVCRLAADGSGRAEVAAKPDLRRSMVVVLVCSSRPLTDAIENVWVVAAGVESPPGGAEKDRAPLGLSIGPGGVVLCEGRPFRGIGVNYFDAFQRRLRNPEDTSGDEGFKTLAAAKIPFARMMGCGFWPAEQKLYRENKEEFFRRFDAVVAAARRHGVGIIPSLFWHSATVPDLVGEPADQWGNAQSKTHAYMRDYVRDVVRRYKDSPAIWGWEFGNEYNLSANLPNAAAHRPPVAPKLGTPRARTSRDQWTHEDLRVAWAAFGREVRRYDAHRMISTGNSCPRPSAWHNWKESTWTVDSPEERAEMLLLGSPDPVSVVSVHAYGESARLLGPFQVTARRAGKPLWVGEFGASGVGEAARKEFCAALQAIEAAQVPLAALWVFDYARQPDWSATPANARAYQLQALAEANARIRAAAGP